MPEEFTVSSVTHTDEDGNIESRQIVERDGAYFLIDPLADHSHGRVKCLDYDHAVKLLTNWIAEVHGFAITGIRG